MHLYLCIHDDVRAVRLGICGRDLHGYCPINVRVHIILLVDGGEFYDGDSDGLVTLRHLLHLWRYHSRLSCLHILLCGRDEGPE